MKIYGYYYLKVFYLGNKYHGIQKQPDQKTIEGELIKALRIKRYIPKEEKSKQAPLQIAGRTDKGVSARAMVVAFLNFREDLYPIEVNSELPNDIFIWGYSKIHDEIEINNFLGGKELSDYNNLDEVFDLILTKVKHPRYNASYRHYKYFLNTTQLEFNFEIIQESIKKLIGRHDFKYLCKDPGDNKTIRTLDSIEITKSESIWIFDFKARSFLWKQIRKMMGALIKIGKGEWELDVIDTLLSNNGKEIANHITIADEKRLFLWDIVYPDEIKFEKCEISIRNMNEKLINWLYNLETEQVILKNIINSF